MPIIRRASELVAALRSIRPTRTCFELASKRQDAQALELLIRTRRMTEENNFAPWDVQLQLLEAYLLLERGSFRQAQRTLASVFPRIKSSTAYNEDEKAVLIRYGASVLWLARGRPDPSCLLLIRHVRTCDSSRVGRDILERFPNPDEGG